MKSKLHFIKVGKNKVAAEIHSENNIPYYVVKVMCFEGHIFNVKLDKEDVDTYGLYDSVYEDNTECPKCYSRCMIPLDIIKLNIK